MELNLVWSAPLRLASAHAEEGIYSVDLDSVPAMPGIYVFARVHGKSSTVLYVGQASNLRGRIKTQLNNLKLMMGVRAAPNGTRLLLLGVFKAKPGQQESKSLKLIEAAFIRHYVGRGDPLLNKHGTTLQTHRVVSERKHHRRCIPRELHLEKG